MKLQRLKFKIWLWWQGLSRNRTLVKINKIVFWWYYSRVPEFYRQWTLLKSISVLSGGVRQWEREWQCEAKRADMYFSKVVELENAMQ